MREIQSRNTRCELGVARRDVTAPVGIYARFWGAAKDDVATGVHRPTTVTAAVIAPASGVEGPSLALVALDYCAFMPQSDEQALRAKIMQRTGYDEVTLLVNLSHSHAVAHASTNRLQKPGGELIPAYLDHLAEQTIAAIREAQEMRKPSWITWGTGRCSLATNRDYWDAERGVYGTGYNPCAPADDTLLIGRATGDDGAIQAIFFNYACHPTTLAWDNSLLSPDYVGAAREVIEEAFHAPSIFLQGASGELGPREGFVGDTAVADRNGRQLGYAAASALEALPPPASTFVYTGIVKSGADIATWAYRPASQAELEDAGTLRAEMLTIPLACKDMPSITELRAALQQDQDRPTGERLERMLAIREDLGEGDTYLMPIRVWRLGDAVLVAIPNEPYSKLQTDLRAAFPEHPILVLGVTNGTLGYLCPAETHGTGRYQEKQSPFMPGSLERTIAAATEGVARVLDRGVTGGVHLANSGFTDTRSRLQSASTQGEE